MDKSLDELFALTNEIKRMVKDYSMVYQLSDKSSCATWYFLPVETFYYLPYDEWVKVRKQWDAAIKDIFDYFMEIAIFHHVSQKELGKFPFCDMKDLYYTWAKETHHKVWWPHEYQIHNE